MFPSTALPTNLCPPWFSISNVITEGNTFWQSFSGANAACACSGVPAQVSHKPSQKIRCNLPVTIVLSPLRASLKVRNADILAKSVQGVAGMRQKPCGRFAAWLQ
jgi:hypothetical protein